MNEYSVYCLFVEVQNDMECYNDIFRKTFYDVIMIILKYFTICRAHLHSRRKRCRNTQLFKDTLVLK